MCLCEHSKGEERAGKCPNVLPSHSWECFMALSVHSAKSLLEGDRSRDQAGIVADPGLAGTCAYQAGEPQVLLEVALCHCPQSSPTLPQECCL